MKADQTDPSASNPKISLRSPFLLPEGKRGAGSPVVARQVLEDLKSANNELTSTKAERDQLLATNFALQQNVAQKEEAIAALQEMSTTDPMTGCLNRRGLALAYHGMVDSYRSHGPYAPQRRQDDQADPDVLMKNKFGLLFMDLDDFKSINDTLGHDAGDKIIKEMASRIKGAIRSSDHLVRLGGDEFVVLVALKGDGTDKDDDQIEYDTHPHAQPIDVLGQLGEKIRSNIEATEFVVHDTIHNRTVSLKRTASIGCAVGDMGASIEPVMAKADKALYAAKDMGRNCVGVCVEGLGEPVLSGAHRAGPAAVASYDEPTLSGGYAGRVIRAHLQQ